MNGQGEPLHKSSLLYNELRTEGQLCDAVIKVKDVEFPIHKIILCSCTPYFRALFTRWNDENRKVFNIPGLSPEMMELIIDFAYTGSVSVTEGKVLNLMLAANQLNVMGILKICSDFLEERLCSENCIGIWKFTKVCLSPKLRAKAFQYILDHFERVVPMDEFLQLTVEELEDILDRDNLNVQEERTVYEAVIKWIAHARAERQHHISTLFPKVRLGLMCADYLRNNVLSNKLVSRNSECLPLAVYATTICHIANRPFVAGFCHPLARPRLPHSILLAIGGWSTGDPSNGIEAYDYQCDTWLNVTNNVEYPRAYHGAAFLNGYVYCVGGFNRVDYFNTVSRLDLTTRTSEEVAPMHYRRCYVSVTVLNGSIYAMGGYDGHARLRTAESYQPEINQWTLIAPMQEERSDASCTTLYNRIYICGGFNGSDCLQTAEYYSPEANLWTTISPMNSSRSGVGVIAYTDHVFAVGGFDGTNRLRSVEAYNPHTNVWNPLPSMLTPRSNFGIEVINHRLFVVGGFNGYTTTSNVEYYDALTNKWFKGRDMGIFRSALSCCAVSGLSNMAEYTMPRVIHPLLQMSEEEEESEST